MERTPTDAAAPQFPVSVKGVVIIDDRVILLMNGRGEWELPGGKLETCEGVEECVAREIEEELGVNVEVRDIVDCWVYDILGKVRVLIVTYGCVVRGATASALKVSDEHSELRLFPLEEVATLNMPSGYKQSIEKWRRKLETM